MPRIVYQQVAEGQGNVVLRKGHFNSMFLVPTVTGPREVLVHNKQKSLCAAKIMVICLNENAVLSQNLHPTNTLESLLMTLRLTGLQNFSTMVLAADRPVTYFELPVEVTENYQLEFPGGLQEGDEDSTMTARREAIEEYGLKGEEDVIQWAPLVNFPAANDAGSNVELYTTYVMLVRRPPNPPAKEGIIPGKCWVGPLMQVQSYLFEQGKQGVVVEWLALAMVFHLGLALHGGWSALKA